MGKPDSLTGDALVRQADGLLDRVGFRPRVHLVLGSGLGGLVEALECDLEVPFDTLDGFPPPSVTGHAGRFLFGRISGCPVVVQAGRYHVYEGHSGDVVAAPVRLGRALGASTFIATNAAGGIRSDLGPGSLMLITDHLNLQGRNPLIGPVALGETRFPDMSVAYDAGLCALAHSVAGAAGIPLADGVYAAVTGPTYETPAEIAMFERMGADAVGMSTVPEIMVARAGGTRCLGFSLITNHAAGQTESLLDHAEVVEVGQKAGGQLQRIVVGVLAGIAQEPQS